ncbi:MAG: hypothetical protein KGS61_10210, partial [Verrucomicrobia bacterium]|nr:hypothetical protein [Verrucomicrobiota bacterium]
MWFWLCLSLTLGSLDALAAAGKTFAEQLTALQGQLAAHGTNLTVLYQLGRLCYDRGAEGDHKAVELA